MALCWSSFHFKRSNFKLYGMGMELYGKDRRGSKGMEGGIEENSVQIPEHKSGKSALFSVAATERE